MKLQLEYVNIKNVAFAAKTYIEGTTLYINRDELIRKIADPRLTGVEVYLATPGESCRISRVGDVIQPRVKVEAEETTFPGSLGKLCRAGTGRTIALRGVAVVETYHIDVPQYSLIDMSGVGASYTEFSKTNNVVIYALPAEGTDKYDYADAIKKASLSASVYLAAAAKDCTPDEVEIYDLHKPMEQCIGTGLPKVVYIYQIFSHKRNVEAVFYGDNCMKMLPTIVHPNEILDGALVNRNYEQVSNGEATYTITNHPIIKELYRRHGQDLEFAGVILTNSSSNIVDKERSAMICATLAKYFLKADLAIITKEGGGHPQLDMAFCCDRLAELGIKSTLLITELMTTGEGGNESIIFNTPNADAIVSTGSFELIQLPGMEKVIGSQTLPGVEGALYGHILFPNRYIRGALSQIGDTWLSSREY